MITIHGKEMDFDIYDFETARRYEQGLQKLQGFSTEGKTPPEVIREQCEAVNAFFDDLFGEGTARALFGGKYNLTRCLDAIRTLQDSVQEQGDKYRALYSRYIPARHAKK